MKKKVHPNIRYVKSGMENAMSFLTPQRIAEIALAHEEDLAAKALKQESEKSDDGELICILLHT